MSQILATHSFSVSIAEKVGVDAAVIYHNLMFWCKNNEANNKNFHDGRYWTYNSAAAFAKQFSYFTERQITRILDKLEEHGLIVSGNYNQSKFDRTKWYSTNYVVSESVKLDDEVHLTKRSDGGSPMVESYTDSKQPDINLIENNKEIKLHSENDFSASKDSRSESLAVKVKNKKEPSPKGLSFANWFEKNFWNSSFKVSDMSKTLQDWALMYDRLEAKGYTDKDVEHAVTFATGDEFWKKNFLSPLKLEKKNKEGILYIDVFLQKSGQEKANTSPYAHLIGYDKRYENNPRYKRTINSKGTHCTYVERHF